ncbi:subtilisin-like protein [Bimuria novae-zelandiae CBS 107.79]|uniref:Subtilisin-like protein n=1 Tax=Bimuria novae-zelandiae CBS 107.79 TaxID=1447943 RepID=A0A6A5VJX1_9PLEO|nr:subtilisin-like protein [Bimuria novae-zelandiae CBS 107.79]
MANFPRLLLLARVLLPSVHAVPTPALPSVAKHDNALEGKYIITLKPNLDAPSTKSHMTWVSDLHARSITKRDTIGIEKTYAIGGWKAYAGEFDDATIVEIKASPEVASVEADTLIPAPKLLNEREASFLVASHKRDLVTQANAEWGLAAISHRTKTSTDYVYDPIAGQGTYAYVVDDSIRTTHSEFEGRAVFGYNAVSKNNTANSNHGSFAAGIIGGKFAGVAKKINLVSVKVFDEAQASPQSVILDGYNWAVNDIVSKGRANKAVINMSLGGDGGPGSGVDPAYLGAINAAYSKGILTTIAAMNDAVPVSQVSPANVPNALTVAASDQTFKTAWFTNYGAGIDFFAPGVSIRGAGAFDDSGTVYGDGTSASAPFVAGVAMYLQSTLNFKTPAELVTKMKALCTTRVRGDLRGSPNCFLNNGNGVA